MGYSTLLLVDQHCRRRVESPPLERLYCTGLHRPDALHASLATISSRLHRHIPKRHSTDLMAAAAVVGPFCPEQV